METLTKVCLTEEEIKAATELAKACPTAPDALHEKLRAILTQDRPRQHTPEWFDMRMHMLTASNVASYLGMNKYCNRKRFLKRLYDDLNRPPQASHTPSPNRGFPACQWGSKHEAEAAILYQLVTGNQCYPDDLGLVIHPQHRYLGASPDRVLFDRPVLIEIKAPYRRVIVPAEIPTMYVPQVQAQLQVCDMDECHFVQFRPASLCAPGILSVLLVKRDDEWWSKHLEELSTFQHELEKIDAIQEPAAKRTRKAEQEKKSDSSTPDAQECTCSPGVYHIYVDERIGIAQSFREKCARESTPCDDE